MQVHLVQLLAHEFYEQQKKLGNSDAQAQQIMERHRPFLEFCRTYLTEHRTSRMSAGNSNFQVQLTNGKAALICPPVADIQAGSMQASNAVPVTVGMSQPGMQGVVDGSYVGVGNAPSNIVAPPSNQFAQMESVRDMTQTSAMIDFTQPGAQMPR